jgi:hypothetical protein
MRPANSFESGPGVAAATMGKEVFSWADDSTALEMLASNSNVLWSDTRSVAMVEEALEDVPM